MKKLLFKKFMALLLACSFVNAKAQCNDRNAGGWNPPITQTKSPSASLGGYALPNTNIPNKANKKVVGDFNGDGLDDIFMIVTECTNASCTVADISAKMFFSVGNGNFNLAWSSTNFLSLFGGAYSIDLGQPLNFIAGNFLGDNKDELLVYKTISGSETTFCIMITNLVNANPQYYFRLDFPGPQNTDPKIGNASLNASKFYAANLVGDSHDELFSVEPPFNGQPSKWFIQTVNNTVTGMTTLFSGSNQIGYWNMNVNYNEFYFANFDVTTPYDELFSIDKGGNWAMIQNFNGSNFNYKWSDMGNGSFFNNNQCGSFNVSFNTNSQLLFGNLDNCDNDIECMIIQDNDIVHPITMEFTSNLNEFFCASVKWPAMIGSNDIYATQSSLSATANEFFTTPRVCTNYLWSNPNICLQWAGGNQILAARQFFSRVEKDGPLQILNGNFYNNTALNGYTIPTSDLIIFRNNYSYNVPSNINNVVFLTDCTPNGLYGGGCNGNTSIPFYNTNGQIIANYNMVNNSFAGYNYKSGASYSMYSLTNGVQNLRTSNTTNQDENFNELNDIKEISITIMPNPVSDFINVEFLSDQILKDTEVSFMDSEGRSINLLQFDAGIGLNTLKLNVSDLTAGWYIIRFVNNNKIYTKKFIKN
jgi:hypothetical protein